MLSLKRKNENDDANKQKPFKIAKEAKVPLEQTPVQVVSVMYVLEKTSNYVEIIADTWPKVALYIPYHNKKCATCDAIYHQIYNIWYKNKEDAQDLLSSIDLQQLSSMDETLLEKEEQSNLEQHLHGLVLNEEYLVMLPRKPKPVAPRKPKHNEEKKNNDGKNDNNKITHEQKEKVIADPWTTRTIKAMKDIFFVKHVSGGVSSWAKFEKLVPWNYQTRFAEHVQSNYNWVQAMEAGEHYLPFLLYFKMGLGKTIAMYLALQCNPPSDVEILCDISLIEQRWIAELFRFFPPLQGTTVYRIYGYDEFQRRVKEEGAEREQGRVIVVDESQEYRCLTPGMMHDLEAFRQSLAIFGLTGTPFINDKSDLFGLNVFMEVSPLETMSEIMEKQEIYSNSDSKMSSKALSSKKKKNQPQYEKDEENPYDYMTHGPRGFYRYLYQSYKNRIFFYEPNDPIKTVAHDIKIPMTWRQTFYYVMNGRQDIRFEHTTLSSGIRNAFDTQLRRISNCLMDPKDDQKYLESTKFDWLLDFIKTKSENQEERGKNFPMIIVSRFKKRGVVGFHKLLEKEKLNLNIVLMTGDTKTDFRANHCDDFNLGKIDVFMISKIGRRGLDLVGAKSMVLMEIPDSEGEQNQTIARCLRYGKKEAQNAEAIKIYRLISTFPLKPPTSAEQKMMWSLLSEMAKTKHFELEEPNALSTIQRMVKEMQHTIDEKCLLRNPQKALEFARADLVIKASSIEFLEIPSKFDELLHKLI